jgi:hypothetical protein
MHAITVAMTAGLCLAFIASPLRAAAPAAQACSAQAYVADPDPQGLHVRSGPGVRHRSLQRLPSDTAVVVRIVGGQGAWLRIDRARTAGEDRDRDLLRGTGWVYAPMLRVGPVGGGTALYRAADRSAAPVTRVPATADELIVHGCSGAWLLLGHGRVRGWAPAAQTCPNPLASCS